MVPGGPDGAEGVGAEAGYDHLGGPKGASDSSQGRVEAARTAPGVVASLAVRVVRQWNAPVDPLDRRDPATSVG